MSSSRLPGKVLMDVAGKPMLERQTERLKSGLRGLPIVVATSRDQSDDAIAALCAVKGLPCFRGDLDDLMTRFIECAHRYGFTHVLRINGDNPLVDPDCCLRLIEDHAREPCDVIYASHRRGWPYGAGSELMSVSALVNARSRTNDPYYLEHTVPFFFDHSEEFSVRQLIAPPSLCRPEAALSVDFQEDLELIRKIFIELIDQDADVPLEKVIHLLDAKPELQEINRHLHKGFDR